MDSQHRDRLIGCYCYDVDYGRICFPFHPGRQHPSNKLNAGTMRRQVEAVAQRHDSRHNAICRFTMPTTDDTNSAIAALVELPIVVEEACLEQPLYQIYNVPLKRNMEDETRSLGIQLDS